MEVVAVVPARGGSKGIPRKNLARLGGFTLTALAVRCARRAGIARVLVSTDDAEIAAEGEAAGGEVPALRPPALSGDGARSVDAVRHVLGAAGAKPEAVLVLQPTSPFRSAADLRAALALLSARPEAGAVISVSRLDEPHPEKAKRIQGGWLRPYLAGAASERPRQELPLAFRLNGALYLVRRAEIEERGTLVPDAALPLVLPPERSLNIDHPFDLVLAEALLERGLVALESD